MKRIAVTCLIGLVCFLGSPTVGRSEVVEEIVAVINDDIVTRSDMEEEEQLMIAEAYSRFTGADLDRKVEEIKNNLLMQLIDDKILLAQASARYDMEKMADAYFNAFLDQQNIDSEEEAARLLAQEDMTVESFKRRMLEMFAPDELIRIEVRSRVSVSEGEIEEFYNENPTAFIPAPEVTLREIVLLAETDSAKEARRAEAQQVRQRVLDSGDFEAVAREVSDAGTKDAGGLLGPLGEGDLSPQLEELAFSLPIGEVSELMETPYGFHLVKIESRSSTEPQSLEEIRDGLRQHLEQLRFITELNEFMVDARAQAEWCIKEGYRDKLPEGVVASTCESM